jgi:hypothetical protein
VQDTSAILLRGLQSNVAASIFDLQLTKSEALDPEQTINGNLGVYMRRCPKGSKNFIGHTMLSFQSYKMTTMVVINLMF